MSDMTKEKGGFFDLPKTKPARYFREEPKQCYSPDHEPPSHLNIPQGQGYRHICSGCGKVTTIIPPQNTLRLD